LRAFPLEARLGVGFALYGATRRDGSGGQAMMEIVAPFDGNTWRAVCTVLFHGFVQSISDRNAQRVGISFAFSRSSSSDRLSEVGPSVAQV
jgi:hypothetical protein